MTPIEKLIEAIGIHLSHNGACEDSTGDESMCENLDCTYCNLQRFLTEFESEKKPWTPPWSFNVPDGAEWLAVDEDGMGKWYDIEPEEYEHSFGEPVDGICWFAGYFEIPPGVDWRTMKIQVKKDGVLLR